MIRFEKWKEANDKISEKIERLSESERVRSGNEDEDEEEEK